jgi:hypothetical protein
LGKSFTLILIVILTSSTISLTGYATAQSIATPSSPEFTLKFIDYSYDIPSTYKTDPYTGQTVVDVYGKHIDNRTISIIIKNSDQQFYPFTDPSSGRTIDIFYNIRYKGMYTENWTEMYGGKGKMIMYYMDSTLARNGFPTQSYGSQFTTILFPLSDNIPNNIQMQFQVETLEGYATAYVQDSRILFSIVDYDFTGQTSGWSSTHTVTIGQTPNYTPNPTPTQFTPTSPPEQIGPTNSTTNWENNPAPLSANDNQSPAQDSVSLTTFLLVIVVLIAVIAVLSVFAFRGHRKTGFSPFHDKKSQYNQNN